MKTPRSISRAAIAFLVLVGIAATGPALAGSDALQVKTKEGVGNYLTDSKGMTLYYFKNDVQDKNACTGPCLEKWPVYYRDQVQAPAGSDAKDFGAFVRKDGAKQTTFKGWPLYYFAGDKEPGDTKGQGIKGVWYVVDPITIEPCL